MSERNGKTVHIVGVPLDHGAGRRGVGMGPSALRIAGLHDALQRIGLRVEDHGDVTIPAPETCPVGDPRAKYLPLVSRACSEVCAEVQAILERRGVPLVIGGDHAIAIGTIAGIAAHLQQGKGRAQGEAAPRLGVIWFDAHGDINTPETSPSGNIHGMPLACLLGQGPKELTSIGYPGPKVLPQRVAQIGLRDLDEVERRLLRESGIHAFTMEDIDRRGMASVMEQAVELIMDETDHIHVSFDIDSVDPQVAPGTGTRKIGGLTYREAHLAMEIMAETGRLGSMELVEVNPILDVQNQTAELAVGLIASALGKRIL
ncbi:MAG: arginase [Planctomycetes bacterium]|nr:arginase [Planctomycetota bacterium]